MKGKFFLGIDLTGSPKRKSAYVLMEKDKRIVDFGFFGDDDEIAGYVLARRPEVIALDAPLTLPLRGNMRGCDKALRRLGMRVFPPLMKGMKKLTLRGSLLAQMLRERGFTVIEVFPRGAQILLGAYTKKDPKTLKMSLEKVTGISLSGLPENLDLLDAFTAAYTALSFYSKRFIVVVEEDCEIFFPLPA